MNIVTSLVLFTSLSTISAEYCEENSLSMIYNERYCTGEGDSYQHVPPHHCRASYLHSATCHAYNYNITKAICTRFTSPCPEAKIDHFMEFVVITQRPYDECYEWVLYNAKYTVEDRMIYTDDPHHMISRMQRDGNDFVSYFDTRRPNCYATTGHSLFRKNDGYPCQRLRIKEGCPIFWVPYTARDPIPPRAAVAGRMANGIRVYITKFDYDKPPVHSLTGHYVEGAANTFASHGEVTRHSRAMIMMVVL